MLLLKEVADYRGQSNASRPTPWSRQNPKRQRFLPSILLLALAPVVGGCVQPTVRPIVGPSGDPTLFISCSDTGQCYELAGRSCPNGYDIQRARGATVESYLVHCRSQPVAQQPAYYSSQPAYSPPGQQRAWAPQEPAQPWAQTAPPPPPAPDATQSAAASGAPNAMSMPRPIGSSEFDLGY